MSEVRYCVRVVVETSGMGDVAPIHSLQIVPSALTTPE
jgi:hypothetical protein